MDWISLIQTIQMMMMFPQGTVLIAWNREKRQVYDIAQGEDLPDTVVKTVK